MNSGLASGVAFAAPLLAIGPVRGMETGLFGAARRR